MLSRLLSLFSRSCSHAYCSTEAIRKRNVILDYSIDPSAFHQSVICISSITAKGCSDLGTIVTGISSPMHWRYQTFEIGPFYQETLNWFLSVSGPSYKISWALPSSSNHFKICNSQKVCPAGEFRRYIFSITLPF